VLNRQRHVIYGERRKVLEGADLHEQIREMIDEVVAAYIAGETNEGFPEEWDLDKLWAAFRTLYRPTWSVADLIEEAGGDRAGLSSEFITEMVRRDAQAAYDRREEEFTPENMRELERRVVLSVLDQKWREHLYEMDYLREGIGLRAMAQRDPLIEYQREGYDLFSTMMEGIKEESVGNLFNLQVTVMEDPIVEEAADGAAALGPAGGVAVARGRHAAGAVPAASSQGGPDGTAPAVVAPGLSRPHRPSRLSYSAPTVDGAGQVERRTETRGNGKVGKVGRNDLCPCGSGRKYKRCHGDPRNRADG
jgi:preprotein translocase subunit SecA